MLAGGYTGNTIAEIREYAKIGATNYQRNEHAGRAVPEAPPAPEPVEADLPWSRRLHDVNIAALEPSVRAFEED